eukprot:692815-Pyramimonas_sp.AAC.1
MLQQAAAPAFRRSSFSSRMYARSCTLGQDCEDGGDWLRSTEEGYVFAISWLTLPPAPQEPRSDNGRTDACNYGLGSLRRSPNAQRGPPPSFSRILIKA